MRKMGLLSFSRSQQFAGLKKAPSCHRLTASPVRGLRPTRASRALTENAPNPRNSTRSPWPKPDDFEHRIHELTCSRQVRVFVRNLLDQFRPTVLSPIARQPRSGPFVTQHVVIIRL
jgi:hypothetical protein